MGIAPNRIDILTSISGVEFDRAWDNPTVVTVSGQYVQTIGRQDLIHNKRAAGRLRDIADAAELESNASIDRE